MKYYNCELVGSSVALDVYVNEYLIYSSLDSQHSFTTMLRPWMSRDNLVRIKAKHSPKVTEAGKPIVFSFEATAVEGSDTPQRLAYMEFPRGIVAPDQAVIPYDTLHKHFARGQTLSFSCDLADLIDKPWEIPGPGITNLREVYDLYTRIQKAFVDKDIPAIMDLSRARIQFCSRLYNVNPARFEARVRRDLEQTLAEDPKWKIIRNPERELTMHEYLPKKVMRVLDLRRLYPLMTVPNEQHQQLGYDIIVALTRDGLVWIM